MAEKSDMYDKLMGVKPFEHYKKKKHSHGQHYKAALTVVPDEAPASYTDAIEKMADAVLAYKKNTGIPHSEDPEHRHFLIDEIENLIIQGFMERAQGDRGKAAGLAREEILSGNFHELLNQLLTSYKTQSTTGDIKYGMKKVIPIEDDNARREAAEAYAKRHPTDYSTKGEIELLASSSKYDELLNLLVADFDKMTKKKSTKAPSALEKKVQKEAA